jgi:hypothetical protein
VSNPLLEKIAAAKITQGGNNIKDGKYIFSILKILSEKKRNGNMFIVEMLVDESSSIPDIFEKDGKPVHANAAGTTVSWVLNLDNNDSAPGNIKAFVLGLFDESEADIDAEELQAKSKGEPSPLATTLGELISREQPALGRKIVSETYRKLIKSGKNAGQPFVGHNWRHVAQTPEEIAANRARVENKKAA